MVVACCYAVTMVVMAAMEVFGSVAKALGQIAWIFVDAFSPCVELLWLISTGQIVRFVVRLARMLGPP